MKIIYGGGVISIPKTLALIALILLVVWLLAGCQEDNVKIVYVDRDVPVQVPLDPRLTVVPTYPADPVFKCHDAKGGRTVCHEDDADWKDRMKAALKGAIKQIKAIAELQPKSDAPQP